MLFNSMRGKIVQTISKPFQHVQKPLVLLTLNKSIEFHPNIWSLHRVSSKYADIIIIIISSSSSSSSILSRTLSVCIDFPV